MGSRGPRSGCYRPPNRGPHLGGRTRPSTVERSRRLLGGGGRTTDGRNTCCGTPVEELLANESTSPRKQELFRSVTRRQHRPVHGGNKIPGSRRVGPKELDQSRSRPEIAEQGLARNGRRSLFQNSLIRHYRQSCGESSPLLRQGSPRFRSLAPHATGKGRPPPAPPGPSRAAPLTNPEPPRVAASGLGSLPREISRQLRHCRWLLTS